MLLNFFGALGQPQNETAKDQSDKSETVEKDPILESLLYGKKLSKSELATAIKRQQDKMKGMLKCIYF
jgi:hypothetical protein